MLLGTLLPLLILALGIWGVVYLLGRSGRTGTGASSSALEILEQRFARGEISAEEFRSMRQELTRR